MIFSNGSCWIHCFHWISTSAANAVSLLYTSIKTGSQNGEAVSEPGLISKSLALSNKQKMRQTSLPLFEQGTLSFIIWKKWFFPLYCSFCSHNKTLRQQRLFVARVPKASKNYSSLKASTFLSRLTISKHKATQFRFFPPFWRHLF